GGFAATNLPAPPARVGHGHPSTGARALLRLRALRGRARRLLEEPRRLGEAVGARAPSRERRRARHARAALRAGRAVAGRARAPREPRRGSPRARTGAGAPVATARRDLALADRRGPAARAREPVRVPRRRDQPGVSGGPVLLDGARGLL